MSQADQKEVLVNVDIARNWQIKLLERINSLTVHQLPEIKFLTFTGNYDEWETFWSSFYNNVDSRDNLEKAAKLSYLLQSLREMIMGLSHTDANYAIAVRALKDRYADSVKQTQVLLQKFYNSPFPCHNAKELRSFLMEYRKVREQMRHVENFDASALTGRSILVGKLSYQTFIETCDHTKNYDFSILDMDRALQYIIGKL